jgi:ferredoxin
VKRGLRVDPIACEAHGLCAELLPERVRLDDWGYPIVDPAPVTGELERYARRAVAACPSLALRLAAAEVATARATNAGSGPARRRPQRNWT